MKNSDTEKKSVFKVANEWARKDLTTLHRVVREMALARQAKESDKGNK